MSKVIGLTGHMRAGKDTVAEILGERGYKRIGFADALKSMALVLNPYVTAHTRLAELVDREGWEGAKEEPEVRRLLQVLGTECVRDHLGQDAWVSALSLTMRHDTERDYVVADVRFPNEADAIHAWGGEVWRVVRPGFEGDGHASERFMDSIAADRSIINDGTIEDLRASLEPGA